MRLPALIALTSLTLGMAACTTTGAPDALSEVASSGSPAPIEDYDWFLQQDAQEARLAYGLAESDDLKLALECRKTSGRLALSAMAPATSGPELMLESGGDTVRLPAGREPSEIHDGVFLTAEAATGDPVFLRFRRIGWLAVWQGEARQAYATHPGSEERIERFFAFCG